MEIIFARDKFEFKLFLNGLWYEPETVRLFLSFTRDYFAAKKSSKKYQTFRGSHISLPGVSSKNRSSDM